MGGSNRFLRLALSLFGMVAVWLCAAAGADAAEPWRSKVSTKLLSIYDLPTSGQATPGARLPDAAATDFPPLAPRFDGNGRVQADVHYDCAMPAPIAALTSAGLSVNASVKVAALCVVEGWVAPAALSRIAAVAGVTRVKAPAYAAHIRPRTGTSGQIPSLASQKSPVGSAQPQAVSGSAIDGNGVSIMRADQFVAQTGTSGAGVTVGVQSIGVSNLTLIQGRRELPAVQVLSPSGGSSASAADEGTALLEEVHAVSPGARLAFCGPQTFIEYTSCLGELIAAGATILVDDVVFPEQDPMSSASSYAQAVEQILTQNPDVALFTVAGNDNGSYWEGQYSPVLLASRGLSPLSCPVNGATQTDNYVSEFNGSPSQILTVSQGGTFPLTFAWADPFNQNVSNFDVYWVDNGNSANTGCYSAASSTDTLISQNISLAAGTYTLYVATPNASLAGKFLKLWIGGDGLTLISTPTPGSIVSPQAFAAGVITIGAVNGSDGIGNNIEKFSSLGPLTVAFPSLTHIQAPTLVAPDGIYVDAAGTYFAGFLFSDGNFYGTSAAVPNAGAVAALLRGAFPNLTAPQLAAALQAGAAQLGSSVPDGTFGYGRIDAIGALGTLPAPTITALPDNTIDATASPSSPAAAFTVSGTGNLHFTVTSSNAALVPPSIVAAGAPGVTITPSTCGTTTLTCSLSVTPTVGQAGTTSLTVSAVDGANRSAPAAMKVNVINPAPAPPPPPPTVTVAASPSGGGGGALGWWEIVSIALLVLLRTVSTTVSPLNAAFRYALRAR